MIYKIQFIWGRRLPHVDEGDLRWADLPGHEYVDETEADTIAGQMNDEAEGRSTYRVRGVAA